MKNDLVQARLRHEHLQPLVLVLQQLELARPIRLQVFKLLFPSVKRLLGNPDLTGDIRYRHATLRLL